MARRLWAGMFRYGESELDPIIHAEILVESARTEARIAILEILLCFGFGVWFGFGSEVFRAVVIFTVITVTPLLLDAALRRRASERLRGKGPQPAGPQRSRG